MTQFERACALVEKHDEKLLHQISDRIEAGEVLHGEDAQVAEILAGHPEWRHWWAHAAEPPTSTFSREAFVLNPGGANPRCVIGAELAIEKMIGPCGDTIARAAHHELIEHGLSHAQARKEISRVLLTELWKIRSGLHQMAAAEYEFYRAIRRLAEGEPPAEIFAASDHAKAAR